MVVPGLSLGLRRAVHLTQSFSRFSRCHVARDIWRSGRAFASRPEDTDGKKPPRPKTVPVQKITLVSPDDSITVTVLDVAQRLAKRRNLSLVKVSDLENKTQRPLYKLVDSTDILERDEEVANTADKKKGTKLIYISAKITVHDLQTKTKNVMRLLDKGRRVKIAITLDGADGSQAQKAIEDAVRNDGSIQRMPSKKNVILLLINPLRNEVSVNNENKTDSSSTVNNER